MKVSETLQAALELIHDPNRWCQGASYKYANGRIASQRDYDQLCAMAALFTAKGGQTLSGEVACLDRAIGDAKTQFTTWQDTHSHAEVVDAFERAIVLAKEAGW